MSHTALTFLSGGQSLADRFGLDLSFDLCSDLGFNLQRQRGFADRFNVWAGALVFLGLLIFLVPRLANGRFEQEREPRC